MTEWITDRPPTEADADPDGDVLVQKRPVLFVAVPWQYVAAGAPWRRTALWQPPAPTAEPAPAAEPAPLPVSAPKIPEPAVPLPASHPFYAVVVSDCGDGTAVMLKTPISDGSLQAALQRRNRIGNRHGMTHIAECRIIPELTHDA